MEPRRPRRVASAFRGEGAASPSLSMMLQAIVQFSLRYRGVVVALAALLVAYGIYVATHAKLDVFPDFVPPQVTVQTESPGLAPEQVEVLVTRVVESAING